MYDPQSPIDDQQFDPRQRLPNTGVVGPTAPPIEPPAPPTPPAPTPFDRTAFRDSINGAPNAYDVLSKYGLTADKSGRVTLPTGEIMDVVRGAGAGGTTGQWMGVGEMKNGQASYYPPAGSAGPGPGGVGAPAGGGTSPFQDQVRSQLLQILRNGQKPIDASDPQIASQMNASTVLADRMAQQQRSAAAERASFNGLNSGGAGSGGFETELRGIQEDEGQQLQGIQADLFGRAIQREQAKLQQALSLAVQSGDAESARAIQMQIANLDNQYRYSALAQQGSQFNDQFGLQAGQFQYQKDRDAALFGGGGF